ncbi:MAG TPA: hypothetical protein DD426_05545 [Clostridiaceae bacterium]|nr:hypothetical protein [Clostridiaceae bacterium]
MDYSTAAKSFSPHYSDIGLGFNDDMPGIKTLFIHYNRNTNEMGDPFIEIPGNIRNARKCILGVTDILDEGNVHFAFYARNSWVIECEGVSFIKITALRKD